LVAFLLLQPLSSFFLLALFGFTNNISDADGHSGYYTKKNNNTKPFKELEHTTAGANNP